MRITIDIRTEDNNLQLVHSILADIIAQTARELPDEIDDGISCVLEDNNCGFQWEAEIKSDDVEIDPDHVFDPNNRQN